MLPCYRSRVPRVKVFHTKPEMVPAITRWTKDALTQFLFRFGECYLEFRSSLRKQAIASTNAALTSTSLLV